MTNLNEVLEFKTVPALTDKLYELGIVKNYESGEIILNENGYIRSIPIIIKGSIRVIRTEEDGHDC